MTERRALPYCSSPSATLSDTASSTGVISPPSGRDDSKRGLRHTRGLRELKARDRSRESRRETKTGGDSQKQDRSRDKSRSDKARDKSKDGRSRDKSKDSKLRIRIREKSRDRLTIKAPDTTSFDILREKSKFRPESVILKDEKLDKFNGKASENRKISKQNTYIFQNGRSTKYQDKKNDINLSPPPVPEHSLNYHLRQSIDSQDYSIAVDDIRARRRRSSLEEEDECQYAEICDNIYSTTVLSSSSDQDSMSSSYNRMNNRGTRRQRFTSNQNWSFGTGTSSSDDNQYSFTLLRQDVGQSYKNMAGFSAGDILPKRHFLASRHAYSPRSPASSQC